MEDSSFYRTQVRPFQEKIFDPTSQRILTASLVTTFAAFQMDEDARNHWGNHQIMSHETSRLGDRIGGEAAVGPLIALGQLIWDRSEGEAHARALVTSAMATWVLKISVQRERPNHRNFYSFPSGHTSSSFATATALTFSYGPRAGFVAYPLATFVALSRISDEMHWLSDTVAGAFIGVWMGRASSFSQVPSNPGQPAWTWTPVISYAQAGISVQRQF